MLPHALLLALLTATPAPHVEALRRELDAVAGRIEELKAEREDGAPVEGELEALLVRAQELAARIDEARPRPAAPAVSPAMDDPDCALADELRDDAMALREEADRLGTAIAEVDAQIREALRGAEGDAQLTPLVPRPARVRVAAGNVSEAHTTPDLSRLVEQRNRLAATARALEVQASRLDEAADALERRR